MADSKMLNINVGEVDVSGDCEIHGRWKAKSPTYNGKPFVRHCVHCTKDENQKREQDQIEFEKKQFTYEQQRHGVSVRHIDCGFETYDAVTEPQKASLEAVKSIKDSVLTGEYRNLIMIGSVGTGKTHLGQSLVVEVLRLKKSARYTTMARIIRHVRGSWDRDSGYSEKQAYSDYQNETLLVIDEVGVQANTENERNIIFEVINERYESCLPTVIICNLTKDELVATLGDRTIDRLRHNGKMIGMSWESARK